MSDEMGDPRERKLVVLLGATELTAEMRAALESFKTVDDAVARLGA